MSTIQHIQAIAFDYYGTLVEIGQPFERIREWFDRFLQRSGRNSKELSDAFFMRFSRERAALANAGKYRPGYEILTTSYVRACERYHLLADEDDFSLFVCELFLRPQAYAGAVDLVASLRQRYRVGLITNADNGILRHSILRRGFLFDFVVTSEDVGCCKPHPTVFERALELERLSPNQMLMVGDSPVEDIRGAQQCGMPAVQICRQGELPGEGCIRQLSQLRQLLDDAV